MLAKTEGFTSITNPRKMACFAGVAPFEFQSGSSLYRKPSVSIFGDKTIKSVLHLGAMSAIRLENDLAIFSKYMTKIQSIDNQ